MNINHTSSIRGIVLKNYTSQAAQKDLRGEAREKSDVAEASPSRRVHVRSEAIERNEAYESFSAACEATP